MDVWILIGVDKITPQVEQEIPAELDGFPVHLLEMGGPAHFFVVNRPGTDSQCGYSLIPKS